MTALSDALDASQAKAVAALGRAYRFREEEPDDELFAGILRGMGLEDEVAIRWLLAAWKVIREEKAAPVGEQAPRENGNRPASDAQKKLIVSLCKERNLAYPDDVQTWDQAHGIIDAIKAGTYNADEWQAIIAAKRGPCRCETSWCRGTVWPVEYHHLVSREDGGDDVADNIVPLCPAHHARITNRKDLEARKLLSSLSDAEYAYMIQRGGEDYPERAYGISYGR